MQQNTPDQRDEDTPPAAVPDTEVESPFDLWLKRGLHQLYGTVAAEPIPAELLRLIEDDRAKRRP